MQCNSRTVYTKTGDFKSCNNPTINNMTKSFLMNSKGECWMHENILPKKKTLAKWEKKTLHSWMHLLVYKDFGSRLSEMSKPPAPLVHYKKKKGFLPKTIFLAAEEHPSVYYVFLLISRVRKDTVTFPRANVGRPNRDLNQWGNK